MRFQWATNRNKCEWKLRFFIVALHSMVWFRSKVIIRKCLKCLLVTCNRVCFQLYMLLANIFFSVTIPYGMAHKWAIRIHIYTWHFFASFFSPFIFVSFRMKWKDIVITNNINICYLVQFVFCTFFFASLNLQCIWCILWVYGEKMYLNVAAHTMCTFLTL